MTTQTMIRTGVIAYQDGIRLEEKVSPQFKNVKLYSQADLKKLVPGNRIEFNSGARAIFWRNRKVDLDEKSRAIFVHYRFEPAYEFIDPLFSSQEKISTINVLHNQGIWFYGDGAIGFSIFGLGREYTQGADYEEARFLLRRGR